MCRGTLRATLTMGADATGSSWPRRSMVGGLVAVCGVLACRTGGRSPAGRKATYVVGVLGSGFKAPRNLPPSLEVVRDAAAYERAARRDGFADRFDDRRLPTVDFASHVIVILERGDEGGTDARPVVHRVVRKGDVLTFDTGYEMLPNPQGLDVQLRPYLYFVLSREAFDGDPTIELVVDGRRV